VHLQEAPGAHDAPGQGPVLAEGRDHGHEHHGAGVGEQARHLGDAPDVFGPVGPGEAQVAAEAAAQLVAVEHVDVPAGGVEAALRLPRQRGLARAGQAREPHGQRALAQARLPGGARQPRGGRPRRAGSGPAGPGVRLQHHAGRHGVAALGIDQDEAAEGAAPRVGLGEDRLGGQQIHAPDVVEAQGGGGDGRQALRLQPVRDASHRGAHGPGRVLDEIAPAGIEGLLGHPHEHGAQAPGRRRLGPRGDQQVPPRHVQVVLEDDRHPPGRGHPAPRAARAQQGPHPALATPGQDAHRIAHPDHAGGQGPARRPPAARRADHALHGQPQGAGRAGPAGGHGLEPLQDGRTRVPGHAGGAGDHVVAVERTDRDEGRLEPAQPGREGPVGGHDGLEGRGGVVDQVHLVHGDQQPAHPQQGGDGAVPPGLGEHAPAGVHQQDGGLRGGGGRRHVARVLLVAGGVRQDHVAPGAAQVAVGHVDGDPLLALGPETVGEEREVQGGPAAARRVQAQAGQLVLGQGAAVVQEPADERGLAVVHAAEGHDPEQPGRGRAVAGGPAPLRSSRHASCAPCCRRRRGR
jgi:hypothetical protein